MRSLTANRLLILLEVLTLLVGALFLAPVLMMGPFGSAVDFTAFSKVGHVAAFVALLPVTLLSIGYLRYPDEFTLALDGPWVIALIAASVPICVAVGSVLGLNGEGIRGADLLVCLVAVPLLHLMVVGTLGRRATQP